MKELYGLRDDSVALKNGNKLYFIHEKEGCETMEGSSCKLSLHVSCRAPRPQETCKRNNKEKAERRIARQKTVDGRIGGTESTLVKKSLEL